MMLWIAEILACGAASTLMGRALFWHVPKLGMMIWRGMRYCPECVSYWGNHELFCSHHTCEGCAPRPEPVQAVRPIDMDLLEAKTFIDCPTAFWLEPTRWERKTWPAAPAPADLRYDGSVNDKILAFAMLTGPERLSLSAQKDLTSLWHDTAAVVPREYRDQQDYEDNDPDVQRWRAESSRRRISSKRNFDRRY